MSAATFSELNVPVVPSKAESAGPAVLFGAAVPFRAAVAVEVVVA